MITFTFNRDLVLQSFAKTDELKEANKADYYKHQNAGLKGEITKLKQQIKLGNNMETKTDKYIESLISEIQEKDKQIEQLKFELKAADSVNEGLVKQIKEIEINLNEANEHIWRKK